MALIDPNKEWLESHVGETIELEWPGVTYVISVERETDD